MMIKYFYPFIFLFLIFISCNGDKETADDVSIPGKETVLPTEKKFVPMAPEFNADSAYAFIQKQVGFGPRVPNTEAHKKCAAFLENKLRSYAIEVIVQEGNVTAFNGKKLQIKNIIGQYRPEVQKRIMLCAHWDTRPFADRDAKKRTKPIPGANDGGSGVAVLLEIIRQLHTAENQLKIGIDFIFFDAEDYGQPSETMLLQQGNTWCLGSQHWGKNPPVANYRPKYGILLDMVGAKDATFPREMNSIYYASGVVNKVWGIAHSLGYKKYFLNLKTAGPITDDHLYVNKLAKIPCIDIVHYNPKLNDFGHFHHTHSDNMDIIDNNTLKAVGQTVLEVIFRER